MSPGKAFLTDIMETARAIYPVGTRKKNKICIKFLIYVQVYQIYLFAGTNKQFSVKIKPPVNLNRLITF
jgi:hypothetical protein